MLVISPARTFLPNAVFGTQLAMSDSLLPAAPVSRSSEFLLLDLPLLSTIQTILFIWNPKSSALFPQMPLLFPSCQPSCQHRQTPFLPLPWQNPQCAFLSACSHPE